MNDAPDVRELRRRLGQQLRSARQAAGYSQAQLARRAGYARSTVSTVESGGQQVPRRFWEVCDAALGTGTALAAASDHLERCRAAQRGPRPGQDGRPDETASSGRGGPASSRVWPGTSAAASSRLAGGEGTDAGPGGSGPADAGPASVRRLPGLASSHALTSGRPGAALAAEVAAAYQRLGWRAEIAGDRVELVCGTVVEALEVPRAPGMVAARWWLHTGGAPDEIRGLPALPDPAASLAVVAAGDRWFFLVQAGACPWSGAGLATAAQLAPAAPAVAAASGSGGTPVAAVGWRRAADRRADGLGGPGVVVRWHSGGSRIPAPPSQDAAGQPVTWACPPPARLELADPVVLLDLLARAVALAGRGDQPLRLPGGMVVAPAAGPAAARAVG